MKILSKIRSVKFAIYKFLGKFIPYFKNMEIEKEEIPHYLLADLKNYVSIFSKMEKFRVDNIKLYSFPNANNCKDVPYIFHVLIKHLKSFSIKIEYNRFSRKSIYRIVFNQDIDYSTEEAKEIIEFCEEFKESEYLVAKVVQWSKF